MFLASVLNVDGENVSRDGVPVNAHPVGRAFTFCDDERIPDGRGGMIKASARRNRARGNGMRILGFFIGLAVLAWGFLNLAPFSFAIGVKTESIDIPAEAAKYVPLIHAMAWWQLAIWGLSISLLLLSGWRLAWGNRAFGMYAIGIILQLVIWSIQAKTPEYAQAFSEADRQLDYAVFAGEIFAGFLIWAIGARRVRR